MPIGRPADDGQENRRRALELLAKADEIMLVAAWDAIADKPEVTRVRGPETGLVMLRGRIGGGGSPFNLGEATLSRATVRLSTGEIGHGQTLGLSRLHAELAAIFDALRQRSEYRAGIDRLLDDIEAGISEGDAARERQTAATKVDFFTMVRGED
jgi:alpha-D-ribose 1-methylphosphonate 5-triphosphate synthase subunit PhnG